MITIQTFRLWLTCIVAIISILLSLDLTAKTSVSFTEQELAWIEAHPEVTFTGDPNWLPFEAFNSEGEHVGIIAEFLEIFQSKSGIRLKKIPVETWSDAVAMAVNGEVDVLSDDQQNQSVMGSHVFTDAYVEHPLVVVSAHSGNTLIQNLNVISNSKIAYISEYGYRWALKAAYPEIDFIEVSDIQDGLKKLDDGDIDFFVSSYTLSQYHIEAANMKNIVVRGQLPVNVKLALAVRSDWPELVSILNKIIASLTPQERYYVSEAWLLTNAPHLRDTHWSSRLLRAALVVAAIGLFWLILSLVIQYNNNRSQQRYRSALAAVNAAEFECSNSGDLFIPKQFFQDLGFSSDQIPKTLEQFSELLVIDDKEYFLSAIADVFNDSCSNEYLDIEFRVGRQFRAYWLRLRAQIPRPNLRQTLRRINGTLEDVTDLKDSQYKLKQNQLELARQKDLLKTIMNNVPDSISAKDVDGRFTFVNRSFCQLFDETEESILHETSRKILSQEKYENNKTLDSRAIEKGETIRYESVFTNKKTAKTHYFDIIKLPFNDGAQGRLGVITISRDITEEKGMLNELERFRLFAEQSPTGFGMTTPDRKFYYLNHALRKILLGDSQSDDQFIGNDFLDYFTTESRKQLTQEVIPQLLHSDTWEGELDLLTLSGVVIHSKQTFHVIRDKKRDVQFICGIAVDTTEENRIKAELTHALTSADAANKSKSIFLANMSHEIRTPLNAVIGYAQLLSKNTELDDSIQHQVRTIESAGYRLLSLINDVLDLSKIEAGKLELTEDTFNVENELKEIIELMCVRADKAGLSLNSELRLDGMLVVKGDRVKFSQVLINFIGNAIKFTPTGGVEIKASWGRNHYLNIKIKDTGPGISDADLSQLFEPFSQGEQGAALGGTGLGLVLSKRIIELMSGKMTIENRQDGQSGLCVALEVPFKPHTQEPVKLDTGIGSKLHEDEHLTALVVDDDVPSRRLVVIGLKNIGLEVRYECKDGREALETLKNTKVDFVFTDIRMPNMTGDELLENIRKLPDTHDIKVVAVSASSLDHQRDHYLRLGFDDFISKPISFNRFNEVIELLASPKWEDADTSVDVPRADIDPPDLDQLPALGLENTTLLEAILQELKNGDLDASKELLIQFKQGQAFKQLLEYLHMLISHYEIDRLEHTIDTLLKNNTLR